MNTYSFVKGLYKWNAAAGSFIQVVRDSSGVPVQIDGTDPSFAAGNSYFFNLTEDTLINYDGTGILMGKTIEPPVSDNPFAGTYTGTFAGKTGAPQGTFTLSVSAAGVLTGSGYNNSNSPATAISPSGTVTTAGAATFNVTFTNTHKFTGTFTTSGASGNFYETDGTTVKGTWSVTKNAVTPQAVSAPVITPAGGTFTTAQSVTITCATSGATIKYTTDGTAPSSSAGNTYSSAITVSSTSVIKAIAIKSGMTDSSVTMASFTIGTQPSGSVPFLRKFGSMGTGNGQFANVSQNKGPINVAVETSTGYIFASDTYAHRIQKFDSNGNFISAFGSYGTGNGQFQYPTGLAVTGGGEIFVVDFGNKRVQKFMTNGTFLKAFGTAGTGDGQFQAPDGIAVDNYGAVYVTDFQNNTVQMFSSEGTFNKKWGGAGTGNGLFGASSPKDIAVDPSGNVYVADIGNSRIQKFSTYGTYQAQWGTAGTGSGQFTSPHGICCDSNGHIFVSDKSCRIQKFSPTGDFILGWGSSGTGDGQFTDPSGICSDSSGNIYVADCGNSRVQMFGPGTAPAPEKVATPYIIPAGGTFTVAQSVNITCATSGATIKYTTDGTTPSVTNGSVYSSAITVSASSTIKAMAYKTGMTDSDVASAVFTINSQPQPGETITIDLGGVTLKMVKIPASGRSFLRGSPSSEKDRSTDEGPQHTVNFTKDYYIGKFEVTQSQWLKIYGRWPIVGISDGDDYPAYYVSWDHICGTDGFLEKINALKPGGYDGFRLPTEAEWEYAARAGTNTRFYWGDDLSYSEIGNYAWFTSNSQWAASPVGQKTANAFGLHDMSGNVGEWCYDVFSIYPEGSVTDPMVSSGTSNRVFRGGGSEDDAKLCRSARRAYTSSGNSMDTVGFRLAMDVPSSTPASKVQTPAISPAGGTYTSAQSVTITCATSGATIYYTTDGTTPSASNGTVYSSAISVTATKTIKAIAVKAGMTDSDAASATFTINIVPAAEILTIDLGGGVTMEMIKVAAAGKSFQMGCPTTEQDSDFYDGPAHTVSFTKDYYIGKYEVTQAQWMKIYGSWPGGAQAPSTTYGAGDSYPAYYVSWSEICSAGGFLEKLNTLKPGGYNGFRLPTEAEWEYAARGGTQTRYYWGDDLSYSLIGNYAWYYNNSSSKSRPAGEKSPNAFGIYDMSGNVSEFCSDYYDSYGTSALTDPTGPVSGTTHVFRGGSFGNEPRFCRSAARASLNASERGQFYGFRIALPAGQTPSEEKVQAPVITPSGGTFTAAQSVTISCATSGAVIYYTTDGTIPSSSNGSVYNGAITISSTATVKAIAVKSGMADSLISSSVITISSTTFSGFSSIGSEPLGKRQQAAAVSHNGKLWVIGGRGSAGHLSDVWSSSDGNSWTEIKANNAAAFSARINHAVVSYAGKLWIIGGYSSTAFADLNDVWSSSDGVSWTEVASISTSTFTRRARLAVVVFNDKMYMIGGYSDGSYLPDVMSSTDGLNWQTVTSNAGFGARAYHSCVVFNNKLWVIGGAISSTGYKNDVWSSPDGVTWTQETSSAAFSARQGHKCFVYGNKMWVVGGQETVGYSNEVWSSSDGINWSKPAMTNTIAAGRAFSAGAVFNDKMWVIGGGQGSSVHLGDIYYSTY